MRRVSHNKADAKGRLRNVLLLAVLTGLLFQKAQGQTLSEWFSQKKTQQEYLLRQIAALQLYAGYVEKGYSIVHKGLTVIRDIKEGEFGLHRDFFHSLGNVNPRLNPDTRMTELAVLQRDILKDYERVKKVMKVRGFFSVDEVAYVNRVYERLLEDCAAVLGEMIAVTTPGKLEMKDGERMERMDRLEDEMEKDRAFSANFSRETLQLAAGREAEDKGLKALTALIPHENN